MRLIFASSLLTLLGASAAYGQQAGGYEQCGGMGWTGPSACVNGWVCTFSNAWYSQRLPASSTTKVSATTSSSKPTTVKSTTTSKPTSTVTQKTTTTASRTTTSQAGASGTVSPPGTTLLPGLYWIRAVTTPHFHEYLQSPSGTAIIASHLKAGQFAIVSGQLVQTTSSGKLYANVEQRSDSSDMLLGVKFTSTPNTFGTFNWSGDALQWTVASITRPNPSAWYVCGTGNELFINLGQYLYGTPTGCSDHTIHFYNGATADL